METGIRAALAACLLCCTAAFAQETLHVDPAKSDVQFTLSDPIHAVKGTFRVESGDISFAETSGEMSGSVVVDARSGNSGNSSRDKKMTNDQMKASKFSTVTFEPKHYAGHLNASGDSDITVDGAFTLLGTPHDLSVPMHVHREGDQCTATGTFVVPYVQWGVKDPSNFLLKVAKDVSIQISLVGSVQQK